jgi:hypothetical protein
LQYPRDPAQPFVAYAMRAMWNSAWGGGACAGGADTERPRHGWLKAMPAPRQPTHTSMIERSFIGT